MLKKWRQKNSRFFLKDRATLTKLALASYMGFFLVWALGFQATASISISAIMTIPHGSTASRTSAYIRKRMLAQIIGVAVAYPLYLWFQWVPWLHDSQRLALPMTLSLLITAAINRKLRLKIADITMLMPGYLVILMTPGYELYPLMRPVYVLLGVLIGYGLNVVLFAPDYGILVENSLEEIQEQLCRLMEQAQPLSHEQRAELNRTKTQLDAAKGYLLCLREDKKRYAADETRLAQFEAHLGAWEAGFHILRADLPEGDSCDYYSTAQALFQRHKAILNGESAALDQMTYPSGQMLSQGVPLARLICYGQALAVLAAVAEAPQQTKNEV
ncbi:hypothetical protein [uncultured Flavonifractor sp.]|uniref:FUSC family protein n=1 Tax=Candidatus Flavonifractor intestinigallinarum TaxID=2838586 RepID=A0A9D2SB12_9FIRM|nr:hypothetical protein [uncultured Flavonifractor sp.]HJB80239.1 hypothetical protein [Candidatus Flavonifractor intestinigallinarum]